MIKMRQCSGCNKPIIDRYMCQIANDDRVFHWSCLRCSHCGTILNNYCHVKNGMILCKEDYPKYREPGPSYSCQGCYQVIDNVKDLVIKIPSLSQNNHNKSPSNNPPYSSNATSYTLYHTKCIQCFYCKKTLNPGDKYVLNKMNQSLVCTSSPCISHYTSNCSSAVPSPYAPSMPNSPLQQQPTTTHHQQTKMSVPSGRGRRGRGGGMYKKQF